MTLFRFDEKYFHQAKKLSKTHNELGFSTTVGSLIGPDLDLPADDWMTYGNTGPCDRSRQIEQALEHALTTDDILLYLNIIRDDKFKPGVVFRDLSRILANKSLKLDLNRLLLRKLYDSNHIYIDGFNIEADPQPDKKVDKIVALDSRGYIYAMMVDEELHTGLIMARKSGKTPCTFKSEFYGTEYSEDAIEIMDGLIQPGDKVLIVDDIVATGGSLLAARKLVEAFGGVVLAGLVVLQVDSLIEKARETFGKPLIVALP
jgi:adenine phosphoribosyltransferase